MNDFLKATPELIFLKKVIRGVLSVLIYRIKSLQNSVIVEGKEKKGQRLFSLWPFFSWLEWDANTLRGKDNDVHPVQREGHNQRQWGCVKGA